jgi:hypothetical protein
MSSTISTALSVAWSNSSKMQIEVIQQLDNSAVPRAQGQPVEAVRAVIV